MIALLCALATGQAAYAVDYGFLERGSGQERRMEGIRRLKSASLDLQLLSFVAFQDLANAATQPALKVRFYVWKDQPVFITAREIQPVHYYFMKPLRNHWPRGWQMFVGWPPGEVLKPLGMTPDLLGVVARLESDEDGNGDVAPVLFYSGEAPRAAYSYMVTLTSRETLSALSHGVERVKDGRAVVNGEARRLHAAGVPITLEINLRGQAEGLYRLWIKGKIEGLNEGPRRTYTFYHQPEVSP